MIDRDVHIVPPLLNMESYYVIDTVGRRLLTSHTDTKRHNEMQDTPGAVVFIMINLHSFRFRWLFVL